MYSNQPLPDLHNIAEIIDDIPGTLMNTFKQPGEYLFLLDGDGIKICLQTLSATNNIYMFSLLGDSTDTLVHQYTSACLERLKDTAAVMLSTQFVSCIPDQHSMETLILIGENAETEYVRELEKIKLPKLTALQGPSISQHSNYLIQTNQFPSLNIEAIVDISLAEIFEQGRGILEQYTDTLGNPPSSEHSSSPNKRGSAMEGIVENDGDNDEMTTTKSNSDEMEVESYNSTPSKRSRMDILPDTAVDSLGDPPSSENSNSSPNKRVGIMEGTVETDGDNAEVTTTKSNSDEMEIESYSLPTGG
jgi:hypothetical protein